MSIKPTTVPPKILAQSIISSSPSFILNNIEGWDGVDLTTADFGTQAFGVFLNPTRTVMELFEYDPATIASGSIDFISRGLPFTGEATPDVSLALDWTANETTVLIGADVPQFMFLLANLTNNQTFTGLNIFTILPESTGGFATTGNQLVTYAQALALATGTAQINRIVVAGNAGEVVAAGNLLYLDVADGEWKKCDADTAASVDNIILGIAQGAGTDGVAITNGVLLFGLDSNQTGLTNNTAYYASNTAGAISSTPGTTEVSVGISRSTTSLLFYPRYNQQLTEDQQDALLGPAGLTPPTANNAYETENDTTTGATITGTTIAFANSNPDTITDSGNGFVTAGFKRGQTITVTGSVSNNNTFTIASVAAGTLTLIASDSLTAESAGASVTIAGAIIGKLVRTDSSGQIPAEVKVDLANGAIGVLPIAQGGTGSTGGAVTATTNGVTSRTSGSGSGSEVIAHGLGRVPLFVNIRAKNMVNATNFAQSDGTYNGTTTATSWMWTGSSGSPTAGTDTTNIIKLVDPSNQWVATITVDATNITLTWTITGTPATAQVAWTVG